MRRRARVLLAALAGAALAGSVHAADSPIVRAADLRIVFRSPTDCDATLRYTVEAPSGAPLDHRLLMYEHTKVTDVQVTGAATAAPPVAIGRSLSIAVAMAGGRTRSYRIAYRVTQPTEWRFRCPVWLPSAALESGVASVRAQVALPAGIVPIGNHFPQVTWSGNAGEIELRNVPALFRAPFAGAGEDVSWLERLGTARLVDMLALTIIIVATGVWIARRRG